MIIWLVCGGRDFLGNISLFKVLDANAEIERPSYVLHGGAKGADALAGIWAQSRKIPELICPANWGVLGKRAGFVRNESMGKLLVPGRDIVFGFPGGRGTAMMLDLARQLKIEVRRYDEAGLVN